MDSIEKSFRSGNSQNDTWYIRVDFKYSDKPGCGKAWKLILSARLWHELSAVVVSVFNDDVGQIAKHSVGNVSAKYAESNTIHDIFDFTFDETNTGELMKEVYCVDLGLTVSYSTLPQSNLMKTLSNDFDRLLQSEASSDVIFEVDGEDIPAHKIILSTRLTYFQSLFDAGMLEATTDRVAVEDIDATSFKAVLKFLYCGRLPEDLQTSPKKYLPVADKYDIRQLKKACEYALWGTITRDNVVEVMIMADMFHCAGLKPKAIEQFMKYRKSLSDEQLAPLKAHPELMLECLKKD